MKIFFTAIIIYLLTINTARGQWQQVQVDSLSATINLYSLSFASEKVGYLAGCDEFSAWSTGALLKTTDGGASWLALNHPVGNCSTPVFFINENIGYSGGQSFLKTINGGAYWETPDNSVPGKITADFIYFITDSVGFITGGQSAIAKTSDGGKTWVFKQFSVVSSISSMFFTSPLKGFAVGHNSPVLLKTINGGNSWDTVSTKYPLLSIHFPTENIGFAVGFNGLIIKTADGGKTWVPVPSGLQPHLNLRSVFCKTNNTCLAVGDSGVILLTTDGGDSWHRDVSGTDRQLNAVICTKGVCYIAGDSAVLLKNTKPLRVNQKHEKKSNIKIYPNPVTEQVTIEYTLAGAVKKTYVVLTDIQGRTLGRLDIPGSEGKHTVHISTGDIAEGVVFCKLYINDAVAETEKIIVTR